jgi:hypothetical protein
VDIGLGILRGNPHEDEHPGAGSLGDGYALDMDADGSGTLDQESHWALGMMYQGYILWRLYI